MRADRLHAPLPRGGARAEELDHVAVRVLHEQLSQAGGARDHVAAHEPAVLDAAGGRVGVVGPEREVRIAGHDLLALARLPHQPVVQDDVQLQVAAQAVPDAREVEGGPRDLREAGHVGIELARLRDVGDGDAHVTQDLEELAHVPSPPPSNCSRRAMPRWNARYPSRVIGGRGPARTSRAPWAPSASRSTAIAASALAGCTYPSSGSTIAKSAEWPGPRAPPMYGCSAGIT